MCRKLKKSKRRRFSKSQKGFWGLKWGTRGRSEEGKGVAEKRIPWEKLGTREKEGTATRFTRITP